ncbi:hypothetical protein F5Y15DRAFT_289439 [Xylariaceae sp. FL0016]|nr:hypothetical protein F5Y15DRAFT_289439 [Xylariaceae sp. FL0016]
MAAQAPESSVAFGRVDRRSSHPKPSSTSTTSTFAAVPRVVSPRPSVRSPPPLRPDRLSLRLRSNSGLALHTNEAALSQYIDYTRDPVPSRPSSFNPSIQSIPLDEDDTNTVRSMSLSCHTTGFSHYLPFVDLLGQDVFQTALHTPGVARQFQNYCKERRCGQDLEFLLRIRDYTQSTNEMASILTAISASYLAPSAPHFLQIPTLLSRALSADIKRVARATLPSLEGLFNETRSHVERRLASTVFPGFVKTQLIRCTTSAVAAGPSAIASSKLEYPGLGESFCLTKASSPSNPIAAVTDAFLLLSGYPLQEVISQNCKFLQGPYSDPGAIGRIQTATREGRSIVELILNHRKDAAPFWNLLLLYPLKNQSGRIDYWLGGQINISENVTSRKDFLRVLNGGTNPDTSSDGSSDDTSENSSRKRFLQDIRSNRDSSIHSRDSSQGSTSSGRFLDQLLKAPRSTSPSPLADSDEYTFGSNNKMTQEDQSDRLPNQRFEPRLHISTLPSTYTNHVLLRCNPICAPPAWQKAPTPLGSRKKQSLKLSVSYYSSDAADLLSTRNDLTHSDIFHLLANKANSPSVTKSFKATIRERIECGKSTSIEVIVDASRARKPSAVGFDIFKDEISKSEKRLGRSAKQEKLMTHWTPMRNHEGKFEWVVLILIPEGQQ